MVVSAPVLLSTLLCLIGLNQFHHSFYGVLRLAFLDELVPGAVYGLTALFISQLVQRRRMAQQDLLTITTPCRPGSPILIGIYRYRFGNRMYYTRYGLTPDQLYGKTVEQVLGSEAYQGALPAMSRVLKGKHTMWKR